MNELIERIKDITLSEWLLIGILIYVVSIYSKIKK